MNALVLDVDETLRSAGDTDNEIPRETLHLITTFVERGVPLVICTGQTLENVKGFLVQGLGNELVHSGRVSIVYEAGAGVFTPGHGSDTKRLLYDDLPENTRGIVDDVRSQVLRTAPEAVHRGCHLQGNEFNVTLKPNHETGSDAAAAVIDEGLVHLLDLVGTAAEDRLADADGSQLPDGDGARIADTNDVEANVDTDDVEADMDTDDVEAGVDTDDVEAGVDTDDVEADADTNDVVPDENDVIPDEATDLSLGAAAARAFYAAADPEIADVLDREDAAFGSAVPSAFTDLFEQLDVALYHADAAELAVRELDKAAGVQAALDVLGIDDPFVVVMGDSKSDLRAMQWATENDAGIAAAPTHSSEGVLEHVRETDELLFPPGGADEMLRAIWALDCLVDDSFRETEAEHTRESRPTGEAE